MTMKPFFLSLLILSAVTGQHCIAEEFTEQQVLELEQKCEAAREAKLKPLREAEIARCKSEKRNDAQYCERFYRNFGDATRTATGVKPRMFHDLPECVVAFNARKGLVRD
jgi:hypothetical protein